MLLLSIEFKLLICCFWFIPIDRPILFGKTPEKSRKYRKIETSVPLLFSVAWFAYRIQSLISNNSEKETSPEGSLPGSCSERGMSTLLEVVWGTMRGLGTVSMESRDDPGLGRSLWKLLSWGFERDWRGGSWRNGLEFSGFPPKWLDWSWGTFLGKPRLEFSAAKWE